MARTTKLARFSFEPSDDAQEITIHIEDETGETLELSASREQLELLADSLDEFLAETEEADEVEDDEDDEDEDEEDAYDDEDADAGTGDGGAEPARGGRR